MSDFTAYIDESGDLGTEAGTQWFVLTAVLIKKTDEKQIRVTLDSINKRLNTNNIHFRKISDFSKRAYVVHEVSTCPFVYMNVIADMRKFDKVKIPDTNVAYNYMCKYLLQRVSWFLDEQGKACDIVLSARGTKRDGDLIKYIQDKLIPYPQNSIQANNFGMVTAKSASSWDMLQIADVCATTMFLSYEINTYGFTVPCFATCLKTHLYRKSDKYMSYGIKYFTKDMEPDLEMLSATKVCKK